jgi:UDP-N-acetylmuramoyl-tripeptide--D-alanyl-D-alanine ligase
MRSLLSAFAPSYPKTLVYMLQSVEYQAAPYEAWYFRTRDFGTIMHRRQLDYTVAARGLYALLLSGIVLQVLVGLSLLGIGLVRDDLLIASLGVVAALAYPFVWAHVIVVPLIMARWLIVAPRERRAIARSEAIFAASKATKIAIAGSYGKTTMKELLLSVLGSAKKVAATPANKNVAISHAHLAARLTGDEDIIIIEYGEGKPGDVARFAQTTHPDIGIITGLAAAHLDRYKTVEAAGEDIFSLGAYLAGKPLYVATDSEAIQPFLQPNYLPYNQHHALGWDISTVRINVTGTSFTMAKASEVLHIQSGLLGRQQIGPLALAAALARQLGMEPTAIEAAIARTKPFEHRMQPRQLAGAWVIDDTYNGNLEGVRAGLALLQELPAKRRIYVTPGLVEQGNLTEANHQAIGRLIAAAQPDIVVLMRNSVTAFIQTGLEAGGYKGALTLESDPLAFYTHLNQFVAAGDIVLMQNDWTDNYA